MRKRGLRGITTRRVCSCGLNIGLGKPALDTSWDQLGTFDMVWFLIGWEKMRKFSGKKIKLQNCYLVFLDIWIYLHIYVLYKLLDYTLIY